MWEFNYYKIYHSIKIYNNKKVLKGLVLYLMFSLFNGSMDIVILVSIGILSVSSILLGDQRKPTPSPRFWLEAQLLSNYIDVTNSLPYSVTPPLTRGKFSCSAISQSEEAISNGFYGTFPCFCEGEGELFSGCQAKYGK